MSNISSQHGPLLKQNRDTGAGETSPLFDPRKGTSPWAWSYKVIPKAVHCGSYLDTPHTSLEWSYYSTTIFLFNFQVCQPKVKEQIIPFIIRWKRKLFWGKNSHWWSFPSKSLISHQCETSRYYKKNPPNKTSSGKPLSPTMTQNTLEASALLCLQAFKPLVKAEMFWRAPYFTLETCQHQCQHLTKLSSTEKCCVFALL